MNRLSLTTLCTMLIFGSLPARAQHMDQHHGGASVPVAKEQAYGVKVFGAFRKMVAERDYAPVVAVQDALSSGATDGVGAVSGLRGEITVLDGQPIISYGQAPSDEKQETASLLVVASVRQWQDVRIDRDLMDGEQIEAFVAEQAKIHGLDMAASLPFRLKGELIAYAMHINSAPNPEFGGHGSSQPMAMADIRKGDSITGTVVGIVVAPDLVGVATHPNERSHSHWVSEDGKKTAHLDQFGVKAGATLMLPSS